MTRSLDCIFRSDVRLNSNTETAKCRLIEQISGVHADDSLRVSREACRACLDHSSHGLLVEHPVLSSLLYAQCEQALSNSSHDGKLNAIDRLRFQILLDKAERALLIQSQRLEKIDFLYSCDVVLLANESTSTLRRSIESLIEQEDVVPFLHLIDTGTAAGVFDEYSGRWNVHRYRRPAGTTTLSALQSIVNSLQTPFIALQSAQNVSELNRLVESINALVRRGAEFCAAQFFDKPAIESPTIENQTYRRRLNPYGLVMRRSSFVDMGGVADGVPDDDVEFVHRAVCEGRKFVVSELPLVRSIAPENLAPVSALPTYPNSAGGTLRSVAKGFPVVATACDVVLPFNGHLEYVEEALKSLVNQSDADVVIHLVDDATLEDTSSFLRRWSQHSNLRVYRNRENIGQFQSFNNVSKFFETEFAAVQDADDISLPHRISWSGQMLYYTGADFFGGAVELFDDNRAREADSQTLGSKKLDQQTRIRRSFYPEELKDEYFAENPTAVFRVSMFRNLGGFADFGDRLTNRTSIDTEFQMRCRSQGIHFALSREVVVRYRVHGNSATQNSITGWGTEPRINAARQIVERSKYFRRGRFDPKTFGSLGRKSQITERI